MRSHIRTYVCIYVCIYVCTYSYYYYYGLYVHVVYVELDCLKVAEDADSRCEDSPSSYGTYI